MTQVRDWVRKYFDSLTSVILAVDWCYFSVVQEYSLFSHVGVFQDVYIDEERLLMFTHTTQKQSPFLQQAFNMETKVKDHDMATHVFICISQANSR